jgi:hypothetical protein
VARARQQPPRPDGPAFHWQPTPDRSFVRMGPGLSVPSHVRRRGNWAEKRGCQWSGKSNSGSPFAELDGEMRLSTVANIMEWVSITALPPAVKWRPFASYLLAADFAVCGGALVGALALFFNKHEIETHYDHYDINSRSIPRGESL